jgi:hypothetical protein
MIARIRAELVSRLRLVDPPSWEDSCWPLEDPLLGGSAPSDEIVPSATPTWPPAVRPPGR